MKNALILILCTLSVSVFATNEIKLSDLAGSYALTSKVQPGIVNNVYITEEGDITLHENSQGGTLVCSGKIELEGTLVKSNMTCGDDLDFWQAINLDGVDFSAPVFTAPVTSELYILLGINEPVLNTFTKI